MRLVGYVTGAADPAEIRDPSGQRLPAYMVPSAVVAAYVSDIFAPVGARHGGQRRFRAAVQEAKIGPDNDILQIGPSVIVKYVTDLQLLGLLEPPT
nr:hypothetical protein [Mycobacterium colombiense]